MKVNLRIQKDFMYKRRIHLIHRS